MPGKSKSEALVDLPAMSPSQPAPVQNQTTGVNPSVQRQRNVAPHAACRLLPAIRTITIRPGSDSISITPGLPASHRSASRHLLRKTITTVPPLQGPPCRTTPPAPPPPQAAQSQPPPPPQPAVQPPPATNVDPQLAEYQRLQQGGRNRRLQAGPHASQIY